ncbi:hypothetical protein G6031_00360 [Dietzia sp. CQ4]|uniref:hypothetical protein n=1 Tax=Dietzia sp. (strain CQ4) TaxID=370437 RepID=UPI0015FAA686|nr:hypothetical protein [Dietzia sp. CQ4]MBB1032849.1 hypothetical protein [Dietzia sp. CQ4]
MSGSDWIAIIAIIVASMTAFSMTFMGFSMKNFSSKVGDLKDQLARHEEATKSYHNDLRTSTSADASRIEEKVTDVSKQVQELQIENARLFGGMRMDRDSILGSIAARAESTDMHVNELTNRMSELLKRLDPPNSSDQTAPQTAGNTPKSKE